MTGEGKPREVDPALCARAYPHTLAWGHSYHPILEEDVDLAHDLVMALARLDISNHTVPGYIRLESRAARRKLIDTRSVDGIASSIEGSEVGAHREGAETFGWPTIPDSCLDLTDTA